MQEEILLAFSKKSGMIIFVMWTPGVVFTLHLTADAVRGNFSKERCRNMAVSKERKNEIIKEYATHEGDTGSVEVQVAVLTEDINNLTQHMREHSHDHHSYVGLLKKIGHRRNLLRYLQENDLERYRALIARLGLRR